jgi:hypothetical protein
METAMINNRSKDVIWDLGLSPKATTYRPELATLAVLMDIRDELKSLNALLCREGQNLLRFPGESKTTEEGTGDGKS